MSVRKILGLICCLMLCNVLAAVSNVPALQKVGRDNFAGYVYSVSDGKLELDHRRGDKLDKKIALWQRNGRTLFIVKPGMKQLACNIVRKKARGVWVLAVEKSSVATSLLCEPVCFKVKAYYKNSLEYFLLDVSTVPQYLSQKKIEQLFSRASSLCRQKKYLHALKGLLTVYKALWISDGLRARALYKIASIFFANDTIHKYKKSLGDFYNARELLLKLAAMFSGAGLWRDAAFFCLATMSSSAYDGYNNKKMYMFMKKAGRLGKIYFEYARNLLRTMPQKAILMTEGGDNQVLGLQMLTRVEKLRPDVTIYDQKGNIFKRIYGDFRYLHAREVRIKRAVVDFEIFSRGRPVYLAWRRFPSVTECGDWALQSQGLLWKVVPLRYKLLKVLSRISKRNLFSYSKAALAARALYMNKQRLLRLKRNLKELNWYLSRIKMGKSHFVDEQAKQKFVASIYRYQAFLKDALSRKVDTVFVSRVLKKLQKEKLIRIKGLSVEILRWSPLKESVAFWGKYKFPHKKYKQLKDCPYLLREIVVNYCYSFFLTCREKIKELKLSVQYGLRTKKVAMENQSRLERNIRRVIAKMRILGDDMLAIKYNLGSYFLRKKAYRKALDILEKDVRLDVWGLASMYLYLRVLLEEASESGNPDKETAALAVVDKKCGQVNVLLKKEYGYAYKHSHIYRFFKFLEGFGNTYKRFPLSRLNALFQRASASQKINDYLAYLKGCMVRKEYGKVVVCFRQMPARKWRFEQAVISYLQSLYYQGKYSEAVHALGKSVKSLPNSRKLKKFVSDLLGSIGNVT